MQGDFRIFGNGKSSKTTKKHQHHKFPSGLGYPKPEGKGEGKSYTLFWTLTLKLESNKPKNLETAESVAFKSVVHRAEVGGVAR